jgi:hypothetical protein
LVQRQIGVGDERNLLIRGLCAQDIACQVCESGSFVSSWDINVEVTHPSSRS